MEADAPETVYVLRSLMVKMNSQNIYNAARLTHFTSAEALDDRQRAYKVLYDIEGTTCTIHDGKNIEDVNDCPATNKKTCTAIITFWKSKTDDRAVLTSVNILSCSLIE